MACVARALEELEASGWLPNQARMWLASQWTVRGGAPWPEGEERFFHHLLDGSRAANRLGWQWTTGAGSSRPYGFSRRQVERRAPGLCTRCALRDACPILDWPEPSPAGAPGAAPAALARDPDPEATGGPSAAERSGSPERVWLTAESLGTDDPALSARPDLPAVFVFDAPLLGRLRLSRKRLVFLVETLAELAQRRALELLRGAPAYALHGRRLAATFTPVPGWRRRRQTLDVVELHPWPWLVRPHSGSVRSFSAWRR
jgi:deoxyribodipyrimidine photo-lyase